MQATSFATLAAGAFQGYASDPAVANTSGFNQVGFLSSRGFGITLSRPNSGRKSAVVNVTFRVTNVQSLPDNAETAKAAIADALARARQVAQDGEMVLIARGNIINRPGAPEFYIWEHLRK